MSRELKQILKKLGEERDITKIYFMKAILIENNNKEKRKESKYMKTVLSVQGRWKSSLVLVLISFCSMSNFIFHGIVSFSLQVRLLAGPGSQSLYALWEMLQQCLLWVL